MLTSGSRLGPHEIIGPIGAGDAVLYAGKCRQLFLELRDLRAHDPLPALDGGKNGAVQRFAKAPALSLEVDKGNGGGQHRLQF